MCAAMRLRKPNAVLLKRDNEMREIRRKYVRIYTQNDEIRAMFRVTYDNFENISKII